MRRNKSVLRLDENRHNFILLKHYNTITLGQVEVDKIESRIPKSKVLIHNYAMSNIVGAFEPFLGWVRERLLSLTDGQLDDVLDKCGAYSLHRSILKSYIETGKCTRDEMILIDEVSFEQDMIVKTIANLTSYAAGEQHVVFLLNDLQFASGSTFHFLDTLINGDGCNNISVIATFNESKPPLPHVKQFWERFLSFAYNNNYVFEPNYGTFDAKKSIIKDLEFSTSLLDGYILQINNLIYCLDFNQAIYYLKIVYKMVMIEEFSVNQSQKYEIIRLYALVSVYSQDFSQALFLCEKLNDFRTLDKNYHVEYNYFRLMCLTYMYNGKLEEAAMFASDCLEISIKQGKDFDIFISKLLGLMVKMSGWHNIYFCASDTPVDQSLIDQAIKYKYLNHLAHIYVYAYDNDPSLYEDDTLVDERLTHFNKGIEILKELGNEYFILEAYRNNTIIASRNGFFKTAAYYYDLSHEIVMGQNDYEEAMVYNGIGYISTALENYGEACACYNKALGIFLRMERIDLVGETLYDMAVNCIMAEDYKNAFDYLELAYRIVCDAKMNSLRGCNVSKLTGLLALCSYYVGNDMRFLVYTQKTKLFLEHFIDDKCTDCDFTMYSDDLFIYYFICALYLKDADAYDNAAQYFKRALNYTGGSFGNQFYIFKQFTSEYASLCRLMDNEEEAVLLITKAIEIYRKQECNDKVSELTAELEHRNYKIQNHRLHLNINTRKKVFATLKHATIVRENADQNRRMSFLAEWSKIVEVGKKSRHQLVIRALNAFMHNFNIDRLMLVKYQDNVPEVLYNNTKMSFENETRHQVEQFFKDNRLGFVTSKINNDYIDYVDIVSLFAHSNVFSFIGIPFYMGESLSAIMVAFISMKDNWHSPNTRYILDENDFATIELEIRQLITSIDILEANNKIKCMNDKLNHIAITDKLTGLYNREGFYGRITKCQNDLEPFTIMYIDLDNFKYYNDTFGHGVGDIILIEMANIFREAVGEDGFVTRFGGDEFLITVFCVDRDEIAALARDIYKRIDEAEGFTSIVMEKLGKEITILDSHRISCSIGISCVDSVSSIEQLEKVVKQADMVLYDVKRSGKGVFRFYTASPT